MNILLPRQWGDYTMLYDVSPLDLSSYAASVALLVAAALLARYLPAAPRASIR